MSIRTTPPTFLATDAERRVNARRQADFCLLRRERELEAARKISEALSQHLTVDALVTQALETATEVIDAEGGSVLLADPDAKQLVFHHFIGPRPLAWGTTMPWDQGLAGEVFQSGLPIVIQDIPSDVRHYKGIDRLTGFTTRDLIALPLRRWEGEPLGVLEIVNKRGGHLNAEDLGLLSIISALTASCIERARLYHEIKLAEIARVVANIGHDIKNMLMPITCGVGLLESAVKEVVDEQVITGSKAQTMTVLTSEVTGMVRTSTRRIQDRMKEIADCVKGRSSPPNFAPCEIRRVIDAVYETLRWIANDRQIRLETQGLDSIPRIIADERRLFNAFYNLVNNAIPEVPAGGSVTVSGEVDSGTNMLLLSVRDTGRGMSPEVRDSLFTAQVHSTKSGGTGLGTKIVKDVVEAHGGTISVTSELGVGTTFWLRLPLRPPQASHQIK